MRIKETILKTVAFTVVLIAVSGLATGCTSNGDTSGFKPEKKPSKEHLSAQIAQIKANPKIPDPIKEKAIKKLEEDMASAK